MGSAVVSRSSRGVAGLRQLELLFAAERSRKRAKLVSDAPKIEA